MAKNKKNHNPETEKIRLDEGGTAETVSSAENGKPETGENRENDLLDLEVLLKEEGTETAAEPAVEIDLHADMEAMLQEDFADTLELSEVPVLEEEEPEKDISVYAPPAEEEPKAKKAVLGSLFAKKNRQVPADAAEESAAVADREEPCEEAPAVDTNELSFVTDSIPAAAAAGSAAEEPTEEPADEEPAEEEKPEEAPKPEPKKTAGPVKMVGTLTVICGIVALLLAAVNALTADVIAENAVKKQSDAILRIFTDGTDVVPYGDTGDTWLVYRDGTVLGYCAAVAPMGYVDEISMMVGVDTADQVVGVQIVEMGETSGIGTKTRSDSFLGQFVGQAGPFTVGENVDGITGATYSSKAVTNGVNMALAMDVRFDGTVPETEADPETVPVIAETEPVETLPVETQPETETETEIETETEPETEIETELETQPETKVPETKTPETKAPETIPPETVPPVPETQPETAPPAPETQPETAPPAPETQPETAPPAPETQPETAPPAPETQPETEPPVPETQPETEPPVPETEPETEPPVPETEPETEPPVPETEPETTVIVIDPGVLEREPETEAETEPETEAETEETEKTSGSTSRLPIRY